MFYRLFLILCCLATATGVYASGIDSAMRNQDKRLEKAVTVIESRIFLGELVERLAAQTGLPLAMNNRDAASGIQVAVHCKDVPVGDVMDAIWALVSNQDAGWMWQRSGKADAFHYELFETVRSKNRAALLHAYMEKSYENYVSVLIEFSRMTPEERQRKKKKLMEAMSQDTDKWAEAFIESPVTWNSIRLFAEVVPPEIQIPMLHAQKEFTVAISELPPVTQNIVHSIYASYDIKRSENDGPLVSIPEPKTIRFYASYGIATPPDMVPDIFIDWGKAGSMSFMGSSALEIGIRDIIKKRWMLSGDAEGSLVSQRAITEPTNKTPALDIPDRPEFQKFRENYLKYRQALPLADRLNMIAQEASFPVLALLPSDAKEKDQVKTPPKIVQEFLNLMEETNLHPLYKWRGNMLLVNYPSWFVEEDTVIPYDLMKRYLPNKDTIITLPDLARLMGSISEAQAKNLAREYPAVKAAYDMNPLFSYAGRFPEILSSTGIRMPPERLATLRALPRFASYAPLIEGNAVAIRLSQQELPSEGPKRLLIRAEAQTPDKQWVFLGGFVQNAPSKK